MLPTSSRLPSILRISAPVALALALGGCHAGRHTEAAAPSATSVTSATTEARPFPRSDAQTALAAAARGLRVCRVGGGAEELRARLRFEPSGEVGEVELSPSGDDPVASCVKKKLEQVAVLPFDGDAVTVRMRVRL